MFIGITLIIWLVLIVLIFPGFLILSVLSDLDLVDRVLLSPGIGIALFVIVSSTVVSFWRYSYWIVLSVSIILGFVLLILYSTVRRFRDDIEAIVSIKLSKEVLVLVVSFVFIVAFAAWRLTHLEIPGDVDSQGFGYLALTVRIGGTINTLAPFYPNIKWLYSPGFFILVAFLSDLLSVPINYAMLGCAYFLWVMVFPTALSVGRQLGNNRLGFLICLFLIVGRGLYYTLANSGLTSVLGCLMIFVCFSAFFKALDMDTNRFGNIIISALALAGLCLSHPDSLIFFILAEVPFFATVWLSRKQPNLQDYKVMTLIPAIAFLIVLPWIILQFPLFFSEVISRNLEERHTYSRDWKIGVHQFGNIVFFNGATILFFTALGMYFASLRREKRDVFLITWVLMIIDFSAFGIIDTITSSLLSVSLASHIYTGSLSWRGPIVPTSILAAQFVHYAINQITLVNSKTLMIQKLRKFKKTITRSGPKGIILLVISLIASLLFPIYTMPILVSEISNARGHYLYHWRGGSYSPLSTNADLVAMRWIKNNTPEDAFILNSPWFDGHWVSVITERKTVFFRYQPFFDNSGNREIYDMKRECNWAFYHPDDIESRNTLYKYGIDYVIVPDGRYAHRHNLDINAFERASYLVLVFREGNAKVYRVINS